jgi:hypothetical protein
MQDLGPGDRLEVPAGRRGPLHFRHLRGTSNAPIVITNQGGRVRIASNEWCTIEFDDCQHVHLTGTGHAGTEYGFDLSGFTNSGVNARRGSEYIEIDHLRIHDSTGEQKGTGIRWSSELDEMGKDWVQHGTEIHHCHFYDLSGEAMYIGKYDDQGGTPLHGVEIAYNRAERCANDAFQVRNARRDCNVHHNYARDIGAAVAGTVQGGAGLIAGENSCGRWHDNVVINADRGIQLLGHGAGIELSHNLLVHCGYVRDQGGIVVFTKNPFVAHHNTIVDSAMDGIHVTRDGRGEVYDNLIVVSGSKHIRAGTDLVADHNVLLDRMEQARFSDVAAGDYCPQRNSPAAGAGRDGGDVGAYPCQGSQPPPPTPTPTPPPPTPTPTPPAPDVVTVTVEIGGVTYRGQVRRVGSG